jgi:hypothetical protein
MILFRKKGPAPIPYDRETKEPAVRTSICTGELTVGFVDRKTGRFHEYELAHDENDVEVFCQRVGVTASEIKRIF